MSWSKENNLQFANTHLAIFLVQRKNDQFLDGSRVLVARCSSSPCPVAVVKKLLKVGRHEKKSRLFRRILHTEKRMELRKEPISYSRANELIKCELQREELDPKLYGVHSLRAGGASEAAALGVADRLFQRQGGWPSERSKNNKKPSRALQLGRSRRHKPEPLPASLTCISGTPQVFRRLDPRDKKRYYATQYFNFSLTLLHYGLKILTDSWIEGDSLGYLDHPPRRCHPRRAPTFIHFFTNTLKCLHGRLAG